MSKPSRQFMVQQAVLNAGVAEWDLYGTRPSGVLIRMLNITTKGGAFCPPWLFKAILNEYRKLENRYAQ